jgi:hypothetical protein
MIVARIVLGITLALTAGIIVIGRNAPKTYYPFYRMDVAGLCTMPTFVQYTTNVLDGLDSEPILQNRYYTTKVFGSCPYIVIYRATTVGINSELK